MGILSKAAFIKRIMLGELLINPNAEEAIVQNLVNRDPKKTDDLFKKYVQKIQFDCKTLTERKKAIKDYAENQFKDKNAKEIKDYVKNKCKGLKKLKDFSQEVEAPILIDYVDPECLQTANYDLLLGEEVYVTTEKVPTKLNAMGKDGVVSIEPGEFGILMTYEYIFIPPDLMGFISVRLTHKQKGLVNISGFHVDPGYYGRLMFAVFNAGPNDVALRYRERVFMIMFNVLTGDGSTVKQRRWSGMDSIPVETLSGLRGTSVSVRNLDERIKRLEMIFPIVVTGVVSLVVAVIAWVLVHW